MLLLPLERLLMPPLLLLQALLLDRRRVGSNRPVVKQPPKHPRGSFGRRVWQLSVDGSFRVADALQDASPVARGCVTMACNRARTLEGIGPPGAKTWRHAGSPSMHFRPP
mmetsp:Transcript_8881/g.17010  ORF Transcript_8881/g.17010 Transcript_8881/m.17010 type:complete len:110 (+) Transcript_8881:230-559(+)